MRFFCDTSIVIGRSFYYRKAIPAIVAAMAEAPFSRRHGYSGQAQEITIWEDAPESLRSFVFCHGQRTWG